MSRQMTRLLLRCARKFFASLLRCVFSMTKIMSAHSICSDDSCVVAPRLRPAESVSTPGHVENTCSAVGLRSLFALQTKRTLIMQFVLPTGPLGGSVNYNVPDPTNRGSGALECYRFS